MSSKNYDFVDLTKFILALLVIAIYARVPVAGWLGRTAVPYFFIMSGYFYFRKYNQLTTSSERFTHYIRYAKRIIKLLVIWNLIYLPLISYKTMVDGNFSVVKTGALLLIGRLPAFGVA